MSEIGQLPPIGEATRTRRVRNPRKRDDQEPKPLDKPTAKSKNAELDKLSVYIPIATLKKLSVASALWDKDKSDIVAELLAEKLSGVTFYDRSASRPTAQTLTVTEIGGDPAGN